MRNVRRIDVIFREDAANNLTCFIASELGDQLAFKTQSADRAGLIRGSPAVMVDWSTHISLPNWGGLEAGHHHVQNVGPQLHYRASRQSVYFLSHAGVLKQVLSSVLRFI